MINKEYDFMCDVLQEVDMAKKIFPDPDGLMCALMEEVGELAKAMLDEPAENIRNEAIQVAAMATRIAIEGDPSLAKVREYHRVLRKKDKQ